MSFVSADPAINLFIRANFRRTHPKSKSLLATMKRKLYFLIKEKIDSAQADKFIFYNLQDIWPHRGLYREPESGIVTIVYANRERQVRISIKHDTFDKYMNEIDSSEIKILWINYDKTSVEFSRAT